MITSAGLLRATIGPKIIKLRFFGIVRCKDRTGGPLYKNKVNVPLETWPRPTIFAFKLMVSRRRRELPHVFSLQSFP